MKHMQSEFIVKGMSVPDLQAVRDQIDREIMDALDKEKCVAAQKIKEVANDLGFMIEDLLPQLLQRKELPIRYRHPEDPELTWCGKGRRPLWMIDAMEKGLTLKNLSV